MSDWGRAMYVTPGVVVDGKLVTTDLVDINLGIRILLGSSFYDDWAGRGDVRRTTTRSATRSISDHPWNQTTIPRPQKRDFDGKYTWVMSPRWYDKRSGRSSGARYRRRAARAAVVDGARRAGRYRLRQGDRAQRQDLSAEDRASCPEIEFEWKIPKWSNTIERDRARTYFQAYAAAAALYFVEQALAEACTPGERERGPSSRCRTRRSAAASTRRCAACCRITW